MIERRLLLPLLLGLVSYAALATLIPRLHPQREWDYRLDRATSIARAREQATRRGLDASAWTAQVTTSYQSTAEYYLASRRDDAARSLISSINTTVMLAEPGSGRRTFKVDLTAQGRAVGYEYRDPTEVEVGGLSPDVTKQAIVAAFNELMGDAAAQFTLLSEVKEEAKEDGIIREQTGEDDQDLKPRMTNGVRYTWEQTGAGGKDLKLRVTGLARNEIVKELTLISSFGFAPRFVDELRERRSTVRIVSGIAFLLALVSTLAVIGVYIFYLIRREIDHRQTIALFAAAFFLSLLEAIFGGSLDAGLFKYYAGGQTYLTLLGVVFTILVPPIFYGLGLALLWSVGHVFARRAIPLRVASMAALLKGRIFSRYVAGRVATGLLCGGVLAAVPYIIAASGLLPNTKLSRPDPYIFVAPFRALAGFFQLISYFLFVAYAFLVPLLNTFVRHRRTARAIGLVLGVVMMVDTVASSQSSGWGTILVAAMMMAIIDWIYWRYDFLALCASIFAMNIAPTAGTLLLGATAALHTSGWRLIGGFGALVVAALVVAWKGRETQQVDESAVSAEGIDPARQRAERERLVAEFGVARQAQQRMLPKEAPRIPGYEIAATCRPAREVGGDLYDFLTLPNERVGIVVADVSGKGVPAALYMTLTKGLLASLAEYESDPSAILREVNRHLYEVCRRKVFVTMILGVLEPATGTLTYARAGHNPGVWRKAQEGVHGWLHAPGLGLGLNKGKLFDQTLKIESVQVNGGDALVFYSDGITEAMNSSAEEYGEERLLASVALTDGLSAEQTQEAILADVGQFLAGTPPQDDITLVVVRVAPEW